MEIEQDIEEPGFRKLATIREIRGILAIEGTDMIELALIDGWQCVVKKGEFRTGDKCIYFEVDSFLPCEAEYEFLRKACYKQIPTLGKGEGFRIRTIKLRKQLSQGLALPVPEGLMDKEIDSDVTEFLGVVKYEVPDNYSGGGNWKFNSKAKGPYPIFLRKTDQERIQNLYYRTTHALKGQSVLFEKTMKLDGSSMQVFKNLDEVGVCSRHVNLKEEEGDVFWDVAKKQNLFSILEDLGRNVSLQGELMGPGIQGNREGFLEHKFFLFNIFDIDHQRFFTPDERAEVTNKYQILHVPIIGREMLFDTCNSLEEMLSKSVMSSINNPVAEGIVCNSVELGPYGEIFHFKIINDNFLLEEE